MAKDQGPEKDERTSRGDILGEEQSRQTYEQI